MDAIKQPKQLAKIIASSAVMGVAIGVLYLAFEWLVSHGTTWLWDDVVQSNVHRWRVIPMAIVGSLLYGIGLKLFKQKRLQPPETSLVDGGLGKVAPTTLKMIGIIVVVGLLSLLAGAALGPEAPLVAASMAIAAWTAGKLKLLKSPIAPLLVISGVGALLAAFFCSLLPAAIPLLMLLKQKKFTWAAACISVAASIAAWLVVFITKGVGYGSVALHQKVSVTSICLSFLLGVLAVLVTVATKWFIHIFYKLATRLNDRNWWMVSALVFGLVIGLLYLLGGQSVQFSGSAGSSMIEQNVGLYTALGLAGLVVVKILVTSWSTAAGYRGGLVFPSVYMGLALSLSITVALQLTGVNQTGATVGAISGIFVSMTSPALGLILLLSFFPTKLLAVIIAGVLGAVIGGKLFERLLPKQSR